MVKLNKPWLLVLAIPIVLVAGVYFFIQSSYVSQKISTAASDATGRDIEVGKGLRIKGIYPKLSVLVPNVRFKSNPNVPDALQRARLENVQVSLSPSLLFNDIRSGEIDVSVERVSLITQATDNANTPASQARDWQVDVLQDAITSLADMVQTLSSVQISLSVDDIDYIARDDASGSSQHRIKSASVLLKDNSIKALASILWDGQYQQQLDVSLDELLSNNEQNRQSVSGQMLFNLSPTVADYSAAKGNFVFAINDSGFEVSELDISNDWAWLRGTSSGTWDTSDISLNADIELRSIELAALGKKAVSATQASSRTTTIAEKQQRVFPFDLFTVALPSNVSGDITVHLGAVRLDTMPIANGVLHVSLEEAVLSVDSNELTLLGGESSFSMEIDNTLAQLVAIKMKLESNDIELERIRVGNDAQTVLSRGTVDTIIALRGEGPSLGHIASSLDGYVLASLADAQVNQRYSTLIDRGLVSWAIDKVSLMRRSAASDSEKTTGLSDPLTLDCASLKVYINDGRAEVSNGAIFELPDNSLFSSGYIDLASEKLGFAFRTRSKSLFDWSAISIIKYAELSGTLFEPKAAFNTTELAKQGVKTASSAAWGPLPSLVYSLAEAGLQNSSSAQCNPHIN